MGCVFEHRTSDTPSAGPTCQQPPKHRCNDVMQEAVQMQRLRHSAVVGFVGVGVRGRTGLLLLEYMEGRDLYT